MRPRGVHATALVVVLSNLGAGVTPGMIDVDLPADEHGVHLAEPAAVSDEGLPLGNGLLGALVWGDGRPLKISLDRIDLWDLRPVPEFHSPYYTYEQMVQWHRQGRHEDLEELYEAPYVRPPTKIPAGRIEVRVDGARPIDGGRLTLDDATAELQLSDGTRLRLFVHATEPVGMMAVDTPGEVSVHLAPPPFSGDIEDEHRAALLSLLGYPLEGELTEEQQTNLRLVSLTRLGYPPAVETDADHLRAFSQQCAAGLKYAVCMVWGRNAQRWEAAWSIASTFEDLDPLALATRRAQRALQRGFESMRQTHCAWWEAYWRQSSVRLPNKRIERQWFLDQYKFGAGTRRGAPPMGLQGPWTYDTGGLPPWKGDYHHDMNTELTYWPGYSANHLDEGLSFVDWLWDTQDNCVAWTRSFFQEPGLCVPMTADLANNQLGGWRQYAHSPTTAAWLAHHFYLHWRYSADREFLQQRAYPYLKEAAVFMEAVTSERDDDGFRRLPLSSSPEIRGNTPDAWFDVWTNYDLALARWLFRAAAELADELALDPEAPHWRQVLSELPELYRGEDGSLLLAKDQPLTESHRHFSHLLAIHPLGLVDWDDGEAAQQSIRASLAALQRLGTEHLFGFSFGWLANLAARARDGQAAERALQAFATSYTLRNSFHCNAKQPPRGEPRTKGSPVTLEGNFAAAAAVQEMLLQSQRGLIRIFPAVPEHWDDVAFTTLRAEGAFLVSARRRGGVTDRVEITAEQGGRCRLVSPFTGEPLTIDIERGRQVVLTEDPRTEVR